MKNIMIIEDNREMKAELISFLRRYGYNAYGPDDFENIVEMALKDDADLIFFIMPLSLAIIHSIVGINIVEEYLQNFGNYEILISSLITALIFVIVYGGYFYATYIGYRNAIDN